MYTQIQWNFFGAKPDMSKLSFNPCCFVLFFLFDNTSLTDYAANKLYLYTQWNVFTIQMKWLKICGHNTTVEKNTVNKLNFNSIKMTYTHWNSCWLTCKVEGGESRVSGQKYLALSALYQRVQQRVRFLHLGLWWGARGQAIERMTMFA